MTVSMRDIIRRKYSIMIISEIKDKQFEYYFIYYVLDYHNNLEVFFNSEDVETFVTDNYRSDDAFQVTCIVTGRLVDIKSTEVETCWKLQNDR